MNLKVLVLLLALKVKNFVCLCIFMCIYLRLCIFCVGVDAHAYVGTQTEAREPSLVSSSGLPSTSLRYDLSLA